ncbi:ferrous iron transport protein B [Mesoterricola silvestris]|uniref:Ferrous iron transport protein B n=1 Tax=Mesoterricola silvestris TaxID=2927979 RepID=A0AA48K814_9BACT|nr:ferrous iron transport protein B [Mesoterricola silvestris]BDU71751.1 ferrous iron transport protein B [Mesoterricola silvestris]
MTTLALAGNPNCGKTTIFNALTGSRHHVGNWPGVTVERRSGTFEAAQGPVEVVDLPGTYSLSARSEDERIASEYVADPAVDLIVNVLDASNLERNLYLTTQLLELGRPMVFVLNMMDDAAEKGLRIDLAALESLLGGPVVPTVGNREEGIQALKDAILRVAAAPPAKLASVNYGPDMEGELQKIQKEILRDEHLAQAQPPRRLALQLLEGVPHAMERVERSHARKAVGAQVQASLAFLEPHLGADGSALLAEGRYGFVHGLVEEVVERTDRKHADITGRLDAVLTHRYLGIPVFIAIMIGVYTLTFVVGKIPQDWIAAAFGWLHGYASAHLPAGELSSLLVDGIIPGVGAVIVFVPVIMLLMGCIAFLEDTGYMARAAFIMDRLMHLMGLHGKSFIPLIMGTGCNVPAVQATRTIEAREDRFITILVAPLISCSARLQIYIVIAGTFFRPVQAAFAILAMHFLGFFLAMAMGKLLRLSLFRGENAPFVMELPPYRLPVLKSTVIHMWEKGSVFLNRAGTVILAGSTLVWFLSHYPGIANSSWSAELQSQHAAVQALNLPEADRDARLASLDLAHESRVVNSSLAARFGKIMEPTLAPILDPYHTRAEAWKDTVALTAGFVAKEIVVSTMAVIHQAQPGERGEASALQEALKQRSGLTPLTALAFMVFTLIYTPCLGTVGMIIKETRSFLWAGFTILYGSGLAWLMAWLTVLGGHLLGFA